MNTFPIFASMFNPFPIVGHPRTSPPWAIAPRWPDRRSYRTQQRAAKTRRNINARMAK